VGGIAMKKAMFLVLMIILLLCLDLAAGIL
jgi:hypothetical protein